VPDTPIIHFRRVVCLPSQDEAEGQSHEKGNPQGGLVSNQSGETNKQTVGKPNVHRHRKGEVTDIVAGVTKIWLGETPFDGRSPEGTLKKMDMSKCSANGVKGDGMFGKYVKATRES
jgi:hypothetical protein